MADALTAAEVRAFVEPMRAQLAEGPTIPALFGWLGDSLRDALALLVRAAEQMETKGACGTCGAYLTCPNDGRLDH